MAENKHIDFIHVDRFEPRTILYWISRLGASNIIHGFLKKPDSITTEELVDELKKRFGKENRELIIYIRRIYNNPDFEDGTYQFIIADVTNIPEHKKDGIKLMLALFNLEKIAQSYPDPEIRRIIGESHEIIKQWIEKYFVNLLGSLFSIK